MLRRAVLTIALLLTVSCGEHERIVPASGCVGCHASHYSANCESCHRGDRDAQRKEIAHNRLVSGIVAEHGLENSAAVREGETLIRSLACRRCHTIGGTGGTLAIDLDEVVWKRYQPALMRSIAQPVENMPRFGMSSRQVEETIAFLLKSKRSGDREPSYRVYFTRSGVQSGLVFDEKCGGCHRALLAGGAAGKGSEGPNLSGLFSGFYPATGEGGSRWTSEGLAKWLGNPRALRPATTMRPVALEDDAWRRLIQELCGNDGSSSISRSRDRN